MMTAGHCPISTLDGNTNSDDSSSIIITLNHLMDAAALLPSSSASAVIAAAAAVTKETSKSVLKKNSLECLLDAVSILTDEKASKLNNRKGSEQEKQKKANSDRTIIQHPPQWHLTCHDPSPPTSSPALSHSPSGQFISFPISSCKPKFVEYHHGEAERIPTPEPVLYNPNLTAWAKTQRRRIAREQTHVLMRLFDNGLRFPNRELRERLGRQLNLTARTVQVWFQNKRQHLRNLGKTQPSSSLASPVIQPQEAASSDTIAAMENLIVTNTLRQEKPLDGKSNNGTGEKTKKKRTIRWMNPVIFVPQKRNTNNLAK